MKPVKPWPERMGIEVDAPVDAKEAWPHMKAKILELRAAQKAFHELVEELDQACQARAMQEGGLSPVWGASRSS